MCEILFESLRELGRITPFNKLTVKDVCEHAGVSKRTFYNHFRDKYDLATWGYAKGLRSSIERSGPTFKEQQLAALSTISAHGAYLDGLFETTSGADSFRRALRDVNRQVYGARWREVMGMEPSPRETFMLDVFLGGMCEAYVAWWREGMCIPADQIATWAEEAIPVPLAPVLTGKRA